MSSLCIAEYFVAVEELNWRVHYRGVVLRLSLGRNENKIPISLLCAVH